MSSSSGDVKELDILDEIEHYIIVSFCCIKYSVAFLAATGLSMHN